MPDQDRYRVVDGVDTHRDAHVAVAVGSAGRLWASASFAATQAGYGQMLGWLRAFGDVECVCVEGTSSYGVGLSRFLAAEGVAVVEVLRPGRRIRRGDKNDSADTVAAARSVVSGEATASPKSADGLVEAIRMLNAARRPAVKARTSAVNQIKGALRTRFGGMGVAGFGVLDDAEPWRASMDRNVISVRLWLPRRRGAGGDRGRAREAGGAGGIGDIRGTVTSRLVGSAWRGRVDRLESAGEVGHAGVALARTRLALVPVDAGDQCPVQ